MLLQFYVSATTSHTTITQSLKMSHGCQPGAQALVLWLTVSKFMKGINRSCFRDMSMLHHDLRLDMSMLVKNGHQIRILIV